MSHVKHGEVINGWLHKRGPQVVPFWAKRSYAIPVEELTKVEGVKLFTKYHGKLKADRETFNSYGVPHLYTDDNGRLEHQILLAFDKWEEF